MFRNALLLASMILSSQAGADRAIPPAVEQFFARPACSVGTVTRIDYRAEGIVAALSIDPRWARTLAKKSEDLRASWFGIHCPVYDPGVWKELEDSEDIFIAAVLPEFGPYAFSCRGRQAVTTID